MPGRQVSISAGPRMQPVIDEARRTFPDAENDSQALTRALFHWLHGRQANSKRAALERIEERLALIERRLGIGTYDDYDTDHG